LAALSNDPLGDLRPEVTYEINYRAGVRLAKLAKQAGDAPGDRVRRLAPHPFRYRPQQSGCLGGHQGNYLLEIRRIAQAADRAY
jgi:hypothetical protein